jgi:hypothetical protein
VSLAAVLTRQIHGEETKAYVILKKAPPPSESRRVVEESDGGVQVPADHRGQLTHDFTARSSNASSAD